MTSIRGYSDICRGMVTSVRGYSDICQGVRYEDPVMACKQILQI